MNLYEEFAKEICDNCKANCEKRIVVTYHENLTEIKCCDYVSKGNFKGYVKPLCRTAEQQKPIMGFNQE